LGRLENRYELVNLGKQANLDNTKFYRGNVIEITPFIEGNARVDQWDKAYEYSLQAFETWANIQYSTYDIWKRVRQSNSIDPSLEEVYMKIQEKLEYSSP